MKGTITVNRPSNHLRVSESSAINLALQASAELTAMEVAAFSTVGYEDLLFPIPLVERIPVHSREINRFRAPDTNCAKLLVARKTFQVGCGISHCESDEFRAQVTRYQLIFASVLCHELNFGHGCAAVAEPYGPLCYVVPRH